MPGHSQHSFSKSKDGRIVQKAKGIIHLNKFSSSSHAELGAKFIEKCFFLFNSIFFSIFRFPKGGDDFSFQMVHEGIDRLKKRERSNISWACYFKSEISSMFWEIWTGDFHITPPLSHANFFWKRTIASFGILETFFCSRWS